jgi:putative DNA methylase
LKTGFGRKWLKEQIASGRARQAGGYRFTVKAGKPEDLEAAKNGTTAGKRAAFRCLMSQVPITYDHIRTEGKAGRMGARLMAIVAEGERGRVYLAPTPEHEAVARQAKPGWKPDTPLHGKCRVNVSNYGIDTYGDLFTPRQLVALTTFSDLVGEAMERVKRDALAAGLPDDPTPLRDLPAPGEARQAGGGTGATAYAEAVGVYLAFAIDKGANYWSSLCSWHSGRDTVTSTFGRQALPMVWDYAEANPLSTSSGNFLAGVDQAYKFLQHAPADPTGTATQADAAVQSISEYKLISTDPPYYDNIGYADLSDFFYVWLRRSLRPVFPDLFATLAVPKSEELVAFAYRHEDGKAGAEQFFLDGMTRAMRRLATQAHPAFPVTIYYAYKQSESKTDAGTASTGWETFLDAVIRAGFAITGTWPMRTELGNRMNAKDTNALASSIVLVCRKREAGAPEATRREFRVALQKELAAAVADLQRGNIAPVDLQQAAIGPGMAVFTRYKHVINADGSVLTVRDALTMINQALDELLEEQEADLDADTRWAVTWFEQFGFCEGDYGDADTLSKAKNTSVEGIVEAGIAVSGKGKVRLLKPEELSETWTPEGDKRLTVWDMVHHLIRVLEKGEGQAAELMAKLGSKAEAARELAYRLYAICDRTNRSQDAQRYNGLVQSWQDIVQMAQQVPKQATEQQQSFEGME